MDDVSESLLVREGKTGGRGLDLFVGVERIHP